MGNSVVGIVIALCCVGVLPVTGRGAVISVQLSGTVKAVRAYEGGTPVAAPSMFGPGQVVTGVFLFDTTATDQYPEDASLGYYPHGLTDFGVQVVALGLQWSAGDGLAQIENDYDSSSPGSDRVRFASYPAWGLTGSQVNGHTVLTVDIDVYEFSAVSPTPIHPLLTSDMPSPGYLVFDVGSLKLQWYEGQTLISTYLDLAPQTLPEPSTALMLIGGFLATCCYPRRRGDAVPHPRGVNSSLVPA